LKEDDILELLLRLYMAPPKSLGDQVRDLSVQEAGKGDQNV
jgi:hypothetical protein